MTATVSTPAEEQVLRECLERIVADVFGSGPAITAVQRKRSQYSSFYGSDVLTVRLEDGGEFQVFLKDFGSHQRVKEGMKGRREREVAVYRDLLPAAGLGTARYYGSHWDEAQGRFWLFLEYVPGVPVAHSPFEYWVAAAGWLGRKDAYFARQADLLETVRRPDPPRRRLLPGDRREGPADLVPGLAGLRPAHGAPGGPLPPGGRGHGQQPAPDAGPRHLPADPDHPGRPASSRRGSARSIGRRPRSARASSTSPSWPTGSTRRAWPSSSRRTAARRSGAACRSAARRR